MTTYLRRPGAASNIRCDVCSLFDARGFAVGPDGEPRSWDPRPGFDESCEVCGGPEDRARLDRDLLAEAGRREWLVAGGDLRAGDRVLLGDRWAQLAGTPVAATADDSVSPFGDLLRAATADGGQVWLDRADTYRLVERFGQLTR